MSITPEELSKKVGSSDIPERTSSNVVNEAQNNNNDFLKMLESALFTPVLSLVRVYLTQSNGTRKTEENCIADFRKKHSRSFKTMFLADFIFRFIYLAIVFIVAIRGLGIDSYVKGYFQ